MRRIRMLCILLFLITGAAFGHMKFKQYLSEDSRAPQITMDKTRIEVPCSADNAALLAGITAMDSKDGDVTANLVLESMSHFIKKGKRTMTVAAFDSDGNVSKAKRDVVYTDYQSPVFSLDSPLVFPINSSKIDIPMKASDMIDGDITGKIKIGSSQSIRTYIAGSYDMTFTVANSAGDVATLPVTLEIYDPEEKEGCPVLTLNQYLIYVKKKETIDPYKYLESLIAQGVKYKKTEDGSVLREALLPNTEKEAQEISIDRIIVDGKLNYKKAGVHELVYSYKDSHERKGTARLIVVVR